jgi:hypothetical protein
VILALAVALGACGGKGKAEPAQPGEGGAATGEVDECREHPKGPTRAECEAVVAHLTKIMPGDMNSTDPSADVCDCLGMPKELIACLGTIENRNDADACVDAYVPADGPGGAGQPRATPEDCRAAVEHLVTVDPEYAAQIQGHEDEIVADCAANATPEEVQCILRAASRADVDACDEQ